MKKKVVMFTIADKNNLEYAHKLRNSLRKFYTEEELPFIIYEPAVWELQKDPNFFYKATPYYAKELIKEYELVIKIDADSIITGDLDHILNATGIDIGCVLNWNKLDPQLYGLVQVWDISPEFYMNCGFVAMWSEEFIKHWWKLCQSPHFDKYQYREQDLLNILIHYGNYRWDCFDWADHWNGLISKGEWPRVQIINPDDAKKPFLVVLPDSEGFPEKPKIVSVLHWGGGAGAQKQNYRIGFSEPVIEYLDQLTTNETN